MKCRVCDANDFSLIIDLGMQPWGNHFLTEDLVGKEPFYPLRVVYCNKCSTAQLDYTVKKEVMFSNHTYLSGITSTLSEHFKQLAIEVNSSYFKESQDKSAMDIGSNDGTQLKHYQDLGYEVLGVESSSKTAKIANDNNIPTLHAFFNLETAEEINRKFDVINAAGVFFHLEELHSVTEGIKLALKENGVFVVQFMYMKNIVENCTFDQIYHEHLLYYTLKTIQTLLNRHGLALTDAYLSPIHGGSMMGFVTHKERGLPKSKRLLELEKKEEESKINELKTYQKLAERVQNLKEKTLSYLQEQKKAGKTIYGFGAPVKGNTLLNYFGIGKETLDLMVEKNKLRKNLYTPGSHIPIYMEDEIKKLPDIYFVLAWNFKNEILRNNQHLIALGVEFYFPL
jgi:2-polyprenyl-3-methyl-5-hydroxy-6-metoxy-1,4-benzoquinol methylase